ncbi:MAG: competence/damage-inducible protein A [Armatimonadetes bacterium]|nr:competence/damage-inducible protein A [Armatimonadota bacterium]
MRAEIVSVGTEILLGQIVDTNAAELGQLFASLGIDHVHRQTVGDNLPRLTEALRLALSRADIVVTIGGLGPTEDDMTRDGVAAALESPLVVDEAVEVHLKDLFTRRGFAWTTSQLRQAQRPACAVPIDNPNGTAPGLLATSKGKTVVCLPGPRNEFVPMVYGPVSEALSNLSGGGSIVSRVLRIVGIGEAALEDRIRDLLTLEDVTVAPYAKVGEVHLRLTTRVAPGADPGAKIGPVADEIRARLGEAVYGEGETSLEARVLELLRGRGLKLATAESLTGGLVGGALTSVDGSSDVYLGGVVAYASSQKEALLGVPSSVLLAPEHGPVSEAVAAAMAEGARARLGADVAVSTTGVAGSSPVRENGVEKASGLVFVGVAGLGETVATRFQLGGNRETIRIRSVQFALASLYRRLMATG